MTGHTTIDARRKKLLWRATHRGIKEMDILLGGFARARIDALTPAELDQLESVIDIPDQQLLSWATSQEPLAQDGLPPLLHDILKFRP